MGSAETSGVSGKGFRQDASSAGQRIFVFPSVPLPVLFTLVATLASVGIFIGQDVARSQDELRERAQLVAVLAASQLQDDRIDMLSIRALNKDAQVIVYSPEGQVLFSSVEGHGSVDPTASGTTYIEARAPLSGQDAELAVRVPQSAVYHAVALRHGWIAAALLLGLSLATYYCRRTPQHRAGTLDHAIETVPYGLAHWGDDGRLICSNGAFARLLRLEPVKTRSGTGYSTVTKTIAGRISARPVLDMNRQRVVEVERDDGSVIMIDERPCPSGGFVTIVTDITERKAADRLLGSIREEQRLLARRYHEEKIRAEASSRAKSSFLAHLSHDIRTPLNHIIGFADMIRLETFGPLGDSKYKSYLADIKQAGEKLLTNFGEILEFAELEGGQKVLKSEPIPILDLLAGCSARFGNRAKRAGIQLEIAEEVEGWLLGDRDYLDRMLANLLDNALRFTSEGGMIKVGAWPADDRVVLEVSDTGVGMSQDQMSRLSQPFALSDAAFARPHDGIGLGIAIARAIAEQSGGRLAIDSLEGIGTTIAISLPLASPVTNGFGHQAEFSPARAA